MAESGTGIDDAREQPFHSLDIGLLDWVKGEGLVTVVAQDDRTGEVLMVAYADREALELTQRTGEMHYRSRSRGLWHKGATSGNVQRVVQLLADCDRDAVLARVIPAGPSCHTGATTCFGDGEARSRPLPGSALAGLAARIAARQRAMGTTGTPEAERPSYTQRLLADRNLRLKKLGEEAAELAVACADGDRARATEEVADLLYHALVALAGVGGTMADVEGVLAARAR